MSTNVPNLKQIGGGHRKNGKKFVDLMWNDPNSNVWGSYQTARPIGTKFGTCLRIRLGMDIAKYNSPLNTTGGISGGFRGSQI